MKCVFKWIFIACLALVTSEIHAQVKYIKDTWRVRIHSESSTQSPTLGVYSSGHGFVILGEEGKMTKVKLPNQQEGWIKTSHLVNQRPAKAQLDFFKNKIDALTAKNKELQAQLKAQAGQVTPIARSTSNPPAQSQSAQPIPEEVRSFISSAESDITPRSINQQKADKQWLWVLFPLSLIISLLLGIAFGVYRTRQRVKARFNGANVL